MKQLFFSVKLHVFRVKKPDILKNEMFKKQTKNTKFLSVKNYELEINPKF